MLKNIVLLALVVVLALGFYFARNRNDVVEVPVDHNAQHPAPEHNATPENKDMGEPVTHAAPAEHPADATAPAAEHPAVAPVEAAPAAEVPAHTAEPSAAEHTAPAEHQATPAAEPQATAPVAPAAS